MRSYRDYKLNRVCIKVTLTQDQRQAAEGVGLDRNRAQRQANRVDGIVDKEDPATSLERDKAGACAELAVSLAFGESWDNRFIPVVRWDRTKHLIHDIGGKEVKSTHHRTGCLLVQKQFDKEPPYILVLTYDAPTYYIVGWLYGREVKQDKYWREDQKRPCFMAPQEDLREIATLFDLEGKKMPPTDDEGLEEYLEGFTQQLEEVLPAPAPVPAAASTAVQAESDEDVGFSFEEEAPPPAPPTSMASLEAEADEGESLGDYLEGSVVVSAPTDGGLSKPWMQFHQFKLLKTVEQVREVVDKAIAHGRCGLDLETEGFDNRINYDASGIPSTVHKIVGYCISVRGVGHYIPIRHRFDAVYGEENPNAPLEGVDAEIKRLCEASQPILTEEGMREDPLASSKVATPSRVRIYFWNAKFDQEFLFPVTGIDFWHPESFEDGMLAAYAVYSDDPNLGLKDKAKNRLTVYDPAWKAGDKQAAWPYEMIEFPELFDPKIPSRDRKFYDLYPQEGSAVVLYACSDAICTEILCETKGLWEHTQEGLKYEYRNVVEEALGSKHLFTYRLEKQTAQAVRDVERMRAKVDKQEIKILLGKAQEELENYQNLIVTLAAKSGFHNFNPGSPQQLSNFLFEKEGLDINPKPKKNEASGFYKTDASTLETAAEAVDAPPVLGWIVKFRQIDKIIGTYLTSMNDNCDELDQLRFKFNQTGATTGRFTAPAGEADHGYAGIPIQGIPAREDPKKPKVAHSLRRIFVAREGYTLVKVDYAGQELRIVANLSGEPKWIDEFMTARSEGREADLHTITAKAFFGDHITKDNKVERNAGKIANFSLIYGGGSQAIMRATKCDKVEAVRRKANFDKSVPTFAGWVKNQHAYVKKTKGVWTAFHRFIAIPDATVQPGELDAQGNPVTPEDSRRIQAACERKSTNFPIQGSGADILKISLVKLIKEFHKRGWRREKGDDSVRMIMTVHDEIVFEIKHERLKDAMPVIIEVMESPWKMAKWRIPLVVEPLLGLTWDAKIDWGALVSGKAPVPEWLTGIFDPSQVVAHVPAAPASAASTPSKPAPKPVTQEEPRGPSEELPTKGTIRIATFSLSHTYLTNRLVDVVFESVAGSLDTTNAVYLRLVDNTGAVLLDPTQNPIPIAPDKLKLRFQDRNLGSGEFEVKEEPL